MFAPRVSDKELQSIFSSVKTVAVIGAKDAPNQPVDSVGRYLISAGFIVIPVHPVRTNVWGLTTYKSILDIPQPIDMVDVFRASDQCFAHAEECLQLSVLPKVFWMQLGIINVEARKLLEAKGIIVVEDLCTKIEHSRLSVSFL